MKWAVEWRGVTKEFVTGPRGARLRAVDGLTLRLGQGLVHGLLGPNGSGKSTALKILLGLIEPTAGGCLIFGTSSREPMARRAVGYLPELPYFHRFLTGRELVEFHGRLAGVESDRLKARIEEVLAWVDLAGAAGRRLGTYSKGMLQRIGLAQALVHEPRLVVLDEPTAGVDPAGASVILGLIRRLRAEGTTVLMTSHVLSPLENLCDRVVLMDRGRLVMEGPPGILNRAEERLVFTGRDLTPEDRAELDEWMRARGWLAQSSASEPPGIEERFLAPVGRSCDWPTAGRV